VKRASRAFEELQGLKPLTLSDFNVAVETATHKAETFSAVAPDASSYGLQITDYGLRSDAVKGL
jgi:hypothetical protein